MAVIPNSQSYFEDEIKEHVNIIDPQQMLFSLDTHRHTHIYPTLGFNLLKQEATVWGPLRLFLAVNFHGSKSWASKLGESTKEEWDGVGVG